MNVTERRFSPLCYLPSGELVCYKYGEIIVLNNGQEQKEISVFNSTKEKIFSRSRYLHRLLRLGVRASFALDESNILLSIGNKIYELNVEKNRLSKGYFCGEGIRPLSFAKVVGISSVDDGIYWGGYLGNRAMKSVNIYKRVGKDEWEVVYTFSQGTINHIHTIVSDKYRDCVWIFTGDFDHASAIWKATHNFKTVECVVCNDQKYRGCVAYVLPEGLLYATDAPFQDNYIRLFNPDDLISKSLFPLRGSCIYGCKWNEQYVFSSTVEGDGRNTSKMEFFFGRKRGAGIKDEYVHLYIGNLRDGFKEIYREKKDWLPYYTFQFGVFKFPYGENNGNTLFFQPVATANNDMSLLAIKDKDV